VAMVSAVAALALDYAVGSLLQIDEIYEETLPDGRLKVVFLTTGVHPTLTYIKTVLWAVFGLPAQMVDEHTVEELQSGTLLKRYKVTVILKPLLRGAVQH